MTREKAPSKPGPKVRQIVRGSNRNNNNNNNNNNGYQDDITLGGSVQTVAQDVHRIAQQGSRMGLVLNASKCELIADSKMVVADPLLASFSRIEVEESSLLGAPMFPGKILNEAWSST